MKNRSINVRLLGVVAMLPGLLAGCNTPKTVYDNLTPKITQASQAESITTTGFRVTSRISNLAGLTQLVVGYELVTDLSTNSRLVRTAKEIVVLEAGQESVDFTSSFTDLSKGTNYTYQVFVVHDGKKTYADATLPVQTPASAPNLRFESMIEITRTSAAAIFAMLDLGEENTSVEASVVLDVSPNPSLSRYLKILQGNVDVLNNFRANFTGLSPNTTYYVKVFAKGNQDGYVFESKELSFKTLE
jgi:hypothetical protein